MTTRSLLVGLIAVLLVPVPAAHGQDGGGGGAGDAAALRAFFGGNGFLNRGLYDLATTEYRAFLDHHPDHEKAAVARYGLAVSLFRMKQYGDAMTELARLRDETGFEYAPMVELIDGQCRLMLRSFDDAAESFARFLDAYPDHEMADEAAALGTEALYSGGAYERVAEPAGVLVARWPESPLRERTELFWGLAEMALDEPAAAAARFEAMLDRFRDGAFRDRASLLLAQSWHRADEMVKARRQYERVVEDGGPSVVPGAMYGLALLHQQEDRPAEAAPLLDRYLEEHADHEFAVRALFLRARVSFDLERYDEALATFEKIKDENGDHRDDAAYWMAKCALRQGDPAAAARRLAAAVTRWPESELLPEMIYDRAVALTRADDLVGAAGTLADFRERFPAHPLAPDALHLAASVSHQQGGYEESGALCRQFAAAYPEHELLPDIAFLTAENEFLRREYEPAAGSFQAYLDAYPDAARSTDARYRLGMSLYHQGRYEDAAPWLQATVTDREAAARFPLSVFALGDVHFQGGRWDAAEAALRAYLERGADESAADDALLKLGLAHLRRDESEPALAAFDELIDRLPDSPHLVQALFERGQALVALTRIDDARKAFTTVLARGHETRFAPYAFDHLGTIAYDRGQYVKAAEHFKRVADASPPLALARHAQFRRGESLLAAGLPEKAERVLAGLLEKHPTFDDAPAAAALRAIAIARQGRHEEALGVIEQVERQHAAALDATILAPLFYEKAWCLRELERPEEAESAYHQLLALAGAGDLRRHAMLEHAELAASDDRYGEASSRLRELLALFEPGTDALPLVREQAAYRLGVCAFRQEQFEDAAGLFETFLDDFPASPLVPSACLLGGESMYHVGRHQQAATLLARVPDEHPDDEACGPSLLRLGECLALLAAWERSEDTYAAYIDRFPDSGQWFQAQFGVGWSRENQGRLDEAVEAYRGLVDRHEGPTAARAQFQIGECFFAQARYEDAVRNLLKVDILYGYPEWSAAALYEAGRCFQEMHDPVQARRQFERVREQHGDTEWALLAVKRLADLEKVSLPGRSSS